MADVRFSRIDEWLSAFPLTDAEQEVRELQLEASKISAEIASLQREYGRITLALTKAQQALKFREDLARQMEQADADFDPEPAPRRKEPRKRGKAAVLEIFGAGPEGMILRADDVRELMAERGWAEPDEDTHSIQVALSRLTREGKLKRVAYGAYQLPSDDEASTPTDVHGQNGDGSEGRADLRAVTEGLPLSLEGAPDEAHRAGS